MELINDVVQHLHNEGIASLGSTLFKGHLPDDDDTNLDTCVMVKETGGLAPDIDLPTKSPTFQVFIRASAYSTGRTKLGQVRTALHQKQMTGIANGATFFYFIYAISEGGHLGRDEAGRDLFSINFQCKTR